VVKNLGLKEKDKDLRLEEMDSELRFKDKFIQGLVNWSSRSLRTRNFHEDTGQHH